MSMFTRCAHCESMFRVTLAQLQASGGQVRCGVCLEVFDAFVTLSARDPRVPVDPVPPSDEGGGANAVSTMLEAPLPESVHGLVDDAAAPPWPPIDVDPLEVFVTAPVSGGEVSPTSADSDAPGDAGQVAVDESDPDAMADPAPRMFGEGAISPLPALSEPDGGWVEAGEADDPAVAEPIAAVPALAESEPLPVADSATSAAFSDEPPVSVVGSEVPIVDGSGDETGPVAEFPVMPAGVASPALDAPNAGREVSGPAASIVTPSGFAPPGPPRTASSSWVMVSPWFAPPGPPRTSLRLVASAAVLALSLVGQTVYLLRAALAEAAPSARPSLETACHFLHCMVALPRLTDRLTIEASDLQALDPLHPNRVTLTATIRNRARVEQALPLLELTLTDAREDAAARKVFGPTEYLSGMPARAGVAANAELGIRLSLDTGDIVATGYRLYLFHP